MQTPAPSYGLTTNHSIPFPLTECCDQFLTSVSCKTCIYFTITLWIVLVKTGNSTLHMFNLWVCIYHNVAPEQQNGTPPIQTQPSTLHMFNLWVCIYHNVATEYQNVTPPVQTQPYAYCWIVFSPEHKSWLTLTRTGSHNCKYRSEPTSSHCYSLLLNG